MRSTPVPAIAKPVAITAPGTIEAGALRPAGPQAAPAPPVVRGERLVAWSALGVLLVAAAFVVHRIGALRIEPSEAPPSWTLAAAPATVSEAVAPSSPESTTPGTSTPATETTSTESPAREAIAAARRANKPGSKPKAPGQAKPPLRMASRHPAPPRVAAADAAPHASSSTPAPVMIAMAEGASAPRSRWDAMHDEIATCTTRDFLEGVICQQKVRLRYCDGWWGRTGDCPSRRDDYGN